MARSVKKVGRGKPGGTRFTREEWLAAALEVLSKDGNASLRIERISRDLHVSKGSFYWHFASREAFLHAIVDYWHEHYTKPVKNGAEATGGSPCERLRFVLDLVVGKNLSGYDFAFDGWASHEPAIADRVRKVYQYRWRYIRSLFAEIGFTGEELDFRTRSFLGFMKFRRKAPLARGRKVGPAQLDRWVEFFTRP